MPFTANPETLADQKEEAIHQAKLQLYGLQFYPTEPGYWASALAAAAFIRHEIVGDAFDTAALQLMEGAVEEYARNLFHLNARVEVALKEESLARIRWNKQHRAALDAANKSDTLTVEVRKAWAKENALGEAYQASRDRRREAINATSHYQNRTRDLVYGKLEQAFDIAFSITCNRNGL